jgi:thiosulfate dehydrogenase [quinone] large subunit
MAKLENTYNYTNIQAFLLVALRILFGWYFLYEGITKIANPDWTSMGYLLDSKGAFAGMYHSMASNVGLVAVLDWMNMWGLTLIGLGLMLGLLTQLSMFLGMLMLLMYYLSHPALASVTYIMPQEGSYLIVNKTLIELFAMAVLFVFPTGRIVGLDRFISKWIKN